VNKYYFNCREGDQITRDRVGMYLPDLDAARAEAVSVLQDLILVAENSDEPPQDCEIQITDAGGQTVLSLPFQSKSALH
jgi:hypothetical protein